MWFCTRCHIEFDPESENLRKESKITIPHEDIEPAITTIDINPDVSIKHTPPIRGGFAELQKKGLKITDYHTTEKQ